MKRFDLELFRRFWQLLKLYWLSEEKWLALSMLLALIMISICVNQYTVQVSIPLGDITSALAAQDLDRFWQALLKFLGWNLLAIPMMCLYTYVRSQLALNWRRVLTHKFLNKYFKNRAFYKINYSQDIDNPDQRISQDINDLVGESTMILVIVMDSLFQLIGFSRLLWSISNILVIALVVYAAISTIIATGVFGRVLVRLNFDKAKQEANFRFGLLRIRDEGESIAFYQGEAGELEYLKQTFRPVLRNLNAIINWWVGLKLFDTSHDLVSKILPSIIMAPLILTGQFEVGVLTQSNIAFNRMMDSLDLIVNQLGRLTALTTAINRLDSLANALEAASKPRAGTRIEIIESNQVALENLTLQTPDYQRTLWQNLSLQLPQNQGMIVVGASGCGKSSLLRAIAGLWDSGSGIIQRPKLQEMLFLPQVPYMVLGSLRSQVVYPKNVAESPVSDEDIFRVLRLVNLPDLAEKFGGLDTIEDWGHILSLGEQQRLSFARLLLHKPGYAVLDEATSALDNKTEKILYEELQKNGITFISVGHNYSLFTYHSWVLDLSAPDGLLQLRPII
ncbi:MAG TPA: ABC transporter ATP-binding protein/permease [Oscillatoriaceae cyanobacterium M33_DOE_052]|uniref:ABC transporter ATP-binding protein/permease n=1 Tax=Planktothricoides sp. SpSt-374 TaxID=2282167 RepID=A0A7C3VT05_9CYAN|nr:ABC transporter ATP-binding protein/permease [Oscillatoriaceae cyanobacterium M33_DOE_052]